MEIIETNELDRTCGLTDEELTERFVTHHINKNSRRVLLGGLFYSRR